MKKCNFLAAIFFLLTSTAIIFAQLPQYYNFNTGGTNNSFPFGISTGKMLQALVVAGEFNQPSAAPSGNITKFYYRVNEQYPFNNITYSFLYIRMGQANITTLPTGAFYTGTMDTVFKGTSYLVNAAGGTWAVFNLTTPFAYNNSQGLIIEIGQFGFSGANFFPACNTNLTGNRRSYSVGGPPFVYSGQGAQMMACGVNVTPTTPQYFNYNTTVGANTIPFNFSGGKMVQWLVRPGELNQPSGAPSGNIFAVYFYMAGAATNRTFTNFTIRMGRSSLTSLPIGAFYTGPLDTVYHKDTVVFSSTAATWMSIPLDVPFLYRNDSSLIVEVGQCGYFPTTGSMTVNQTILTGNRRSWSVGACPFVFADQATQVAHFGVYILIPVGINTNNNQVPAQFKLEQNYPNPFNPVTTINFALPKGAAVKLTVFDILGREVEVLVNEYKAPGNYSVNFDATNYASGVYLYKIETAGFVETKKMQLIK